MEFPFVGEEAGFSRTMEERRMVDTGGEKDGCMAVARLHNYTKVQGGAKIRDFAHHGGGSRGFRHCGGVAKGRRWREEDGWAAVAQGGAVTSGFHALPSDEFVDFCSCGGIVGYKRKNRLLAVHHAVAANQSDAAAHGCQLVLSLISAAVRLMAGNFLPLCSVFLVVSVYYLVIMLLLKEIPDLEGDKVTGLQTLSVHFGPKQVFWSCVVLLEMAYGVAIIMGATSPFLWSKIFTVIAHGIMALIFWYRADSVDLKNKDASQSFYMFIYKLLFVENILILFVR